MTAAAEWAARISCAATAAQQYHGNEQTLLGYWRRRMAGGHYGDYLDCVATLTGKPHIADAHGLCNWLHKQATGVYPGQEAGGRKHRDISADIRQGLAEHFARHFADPEDDAPNDDTTRDRIEQATLALLLLTALLHSGKLTRTAFVAQVSADLEAAADDVGEFEPGTLTDDLDRYAQRVLDGTASERQLGAWAAGLAGGAIWSSYQRGKLADDPRAAAADDWWNWEAAADACPGCAAKAEGGPYRTADVPGVPGDGSTPCRGACRCDVVPTDPPNR